MNFARAGLSMFPWAYFRLTNAVVKMHALLDLHRSIPSFIHVSDGKLNDGHALDGFYTRHDEVVPPVQLEAWLEAAAHDPQPEISIRCGRKVVYERVAQVIVAVPRSGLLKLGFVTEPGN